MSPDEWRMFVFGVIGSTAVEIANVVRVYEAGKQVTTCKSRT